MTAKPSSTSGLWTAIVTGVVCVLLVGTITAIGLKARKEVPWFGVTSLVANIGVIGAGYKIIMDTLKNAADLRKAGLEIEKLRFEVEEKRASAKQSESRITLATFEDIKKYSPSARAITLALVGTITSFLLGTYFAYFNNPINVSTPVPTDAGSYKAPAQPLPATKGDNSPGIANYSEHVTIGPESRIACDHGRAKVTGPTFRAMIFQDDGLTSGTEPLVVVYRDEGKTHNLPLEPSGEASGQYRIGNGYSRVLLSDFTVETLNGKTIAHCSIVPNELDHKRTALDEWMGSVAVHTPE
jgi:hypothetical protein